MTLFEVDLVGDEDPSVTDVNSAVSVSGVADGRQVYEDLLTDRAETENRPSKRMMRKTLSHPMSTNKENGRRKSTDRKILHCDGCDKLYTARATSNGDLVPTNTSRCTKCGDEQFTQVELQDITVIPG